VDAPITDSLQLILRRFTPGGGFAQRSGNRFRSDATVWGILALTASNMNLDAAFDAAGWLASIQIEDGRVSVLESLRTACWPTALSVLAWKKVGGYFTQREKAIKYLLGSSGIHFPKEFNSPIGHDTSIRGWPWIENTHSWVEPTAISILALKANGNERHDRVLEAVRMILDRQLLSAGWNYGNTTVFNRELLPMPENTGQALCSLSGYVQAPEVQKSIDYLKKQLPGLHTPLSLCWCLFGLWAWSVDVPDAQTRVLNCLSLQKKFGAYDTTLLALLVIAYFTKGDLLGFLNS
jgi:hypothetical protein